MKRDFGGFLIVAGGYLILLAGIVAAGIALWGVPK